MKKIVLPCIVSLSLLVLFSCAKQDLIPEDAEKTELITRSQQEDRPFYYYFGEKIYLTEQTDKVLI